MTEIALLPLLAVVALIAYVAGWLSHTRRNGALSRRLDVERADLAVWAAHLDMRSAEIPLGERAIDSGMPVYAAPIRLSEPPTRSTPVDDILRRLRDERAAAEIVAGQRRGLEPAPSASVLVVGGPITQEMRRVGSGTTDLETYLLTQLESLVP